MNHGISNAASQDARHTDTGPNSSATQAASDAPQVVMIAGRRGKWKEDQQSRLGYGSEKDIVPLRQSPEPMATSTSDESAWSAYNTPPRWPTERKAAYRSGLSRDGVVLDEYLWLSTDRDEEKKPTGRVVILDNAGERHELETFTGAARQNIATVLLSMRDCTQEANAKVQQELTSMKYTKRLEDWSRYYSRFESAKDHFTELQRTNLETVSVAVAHQLLSALVEPMKAHELLFTDQKDLGFDDIYQLCQPTCICENHPIEPAEQTEHTGTGE